MGKIHLAFGPESLRQIVLGKILETFTETTITDPEILRKEMMRKSLAG